MATRTENVPDPGTAVKAGPAPVRGVVCHLIASNFAGGPEKQIVELSTRLPALGWPTVIGAFRENRPTVEVIENARARGVPTFLIDTRSGFSPLAAWHLARILKRHGVTLLVTHGYKSDLVGRLATAGTRVVQVPMVRGYTAEDWKVRLYERIDRGLLRRSRIVLCVSAATQEMLVRLGVARERVRVLHNAVDDDRAPVPLNLTEEFGLPRDARVLVAAGRLSPEKGHRHLVEAMARLKDHDPPIVLVILGSGRERERLREQIAAAGLAGRVVLGGFRADVLRCIAGADLIVNPSLSEGLPNVVLEALALSRPVVATDVGGVSELITSGQTGWLVPPAHPAALAEAITAALDDAPRTRALAEAGRRRVAMSFSFSGQAKRFADLCPELLTIAKR
jgi:glycosyltransferase involved in cell wall biosynthesis